MLETIYQLPIPLHCVRAVKYANTNARSTHTSHILCDTRLSSVTDARNNAARDSRFCFSLECNPFPFHLHAHLRLISAANSIVLCRIALLQHNPYWSQALPAGLQDATPLGTSQDDRQSGVTDDHSDSGTNNRLTRDLLQDGEKGISLRSWLSRPLWYNDVAASQTCNQVRRSSPGSSQLMLCYDSVYEHFELVCDQAAVCSSHPFPDAEAFWPKFLIGGVGVPLVSLEQPPDLSGDALALSAISAALSVTVVG